MTKKSLLIGFVLAVVSAPTSSALAQTQVIVPFPPGGGLDSVIRVMTQKIQEQTKEVFIVDNRPGANGMIGTRVAAKAKPDGKTWLAVDGAVMTVNPILYQGTSSFDSFRDLKVVAAVGFHPSILVVNPAFGANTIKEFVELARKRDIFYASGGIGSAGHLTMEYFASVAGLKLTHIPYKGGAPAINDLLGGQIPVAFVSLPNAIPHVRTGKLIALAVSSQQRNAQIPSVPTVAESGFPGFEVGTGFFIMIPAKTPKNVVKEVEYNFQRALSEPAIQDRIRKLGVEPALKMTMEDASMWLDVERAKWSRLILEKNIKAE